MRISDWSSDVCSSDLDGRELQRDALAERQRALGADQQVREVVGRTIRSQRIEVVAADPAQDLGEARADLRRLASAEIEQVLDKGGAGIVLIEAGISIATHLAENPLGTVRENLETRSVGKETVHTYTRRRST